VTAAATAPPSASTSVDDQALDQMLRSVEKVK
jgi:hypothetical protein